MSTTIVNLYRDPYDVYIGRAGRGQDGFFGNPFDTANRDQNIAQFEDYFYTRLKSDAQFRYRVHQLRDKVLGCFCKPKPCHGDVIVDYLNRLPETKPIRLGVVGSRTFDNYDYLKNTLQWFHISFIISGGNPGTKVFIPGKGTVILPGADKLAIRYAIEHKIPHKEFLPNWSLGKKAGPLRNQKIVAAADEIVAFWDGKSKGTWWTISYAEEYNKPCHIFWPEITDQELFE